MGRNLKLLAAILIYTLLVNYQNTNAQEVSSKRGSISSQIDSLVNGYYQNEKFNGSVLVAQNGNILLNKEYGFVKVNSERKIDSESVFEIASISKQFTATLVMMLKQEKKLDYEDKITKYLPSLPYDNISIRHLLTHTSGLSEKQFFMWARQNMDPTKIYTNKFILSYLEQEKPSLAFEPGEKWEYSNLGYFLLPLIIEKTSGKQFIELLNEKIFKPLSMTNTGIYSQKFKGSEMENYVFGKVFNPKDSSFISSFGMAWSDSLYGGVGILSNTTDLLKWDRALYGNKLINQELLSEAFTAFKLADGNSTGYGFGWYVKENTKINEVNCGKRLEHNGLWPGYESSIIRYIDYDKTIVILSNQSPSTKDILVEQISELLFIGK